jgi:MoaA/NifB/PqqE/SkfB family radical SAM enzyme
VVHFSPPFAIIIYFLKDFEQALIRFPSPFLSFQPVLEQAQIKYIQVHEVNMFYLGIVTTAHCSLKCKHCIGDMPEIKEKEQYSFTYEEYKKYLDNLLVNITNLKLARILGGEPLLNKGIHKILEYTLLQDKITAVFLVTNATIKLNERTINVLKKFPQKATVDISNYSSNKEILNRLKIQEIIEQCKKNEIKINCPESYLWNPVSSVKYQKRTDKENKKYYRLCASICVGMHKTPDGRAGIFPCLRAGTIFLRKIGNQKEGNDYFLLDHQIEKKEIMNFHKFANFDACRYCNFLEDIRTSVTPALQKNCPPSLADG